MQNIPSIKVLAPPVQDQTSAEVYLDQLQASLSLITEKKDRIKVLEKIADLSLRLDRIDESLNTYLTIVKLDRLNLAAFEGILNIRISQKAWEKAFNIFRHIDHVFIPIGKKKADTQFYNQWIITGTQIYKSFIAEERWIQAESIIQPLLNLYEKLKDQNARHQLQAPSLKQVEFNLGELYYAMGICEYKLGNPERANFFFQKVPADSPHAHLKEVYLVKIFKQSNKWDRLLTTLKRSLLTATTHDEKIKTWLEIARINTIHQKNPSDSFLYLHKLSLNPNLGLEILQQCRQLTNTILFEGIPSITIYNKLLDLYTHFECEVLKISNDNERFSGYLALAQKLTSKNFNPIKIIEFYLIALAIDPKKIEILHTIFRLANPPSYLPTSTKLNHETQKAIFGKVKQVLIEIQLTNLDACLALTVEWFELNKTKLHNEHLSFLANIVGRILTPETLQSRILELVNPYHHLASTEKILFNLIKQNPATPHIYRILIENDQAKFRFEDAAKKSSVLKLFDTLSLKEEMLIKKFLHFKTWQENETPVTCSPYTFQLFKFRSAQAPSPAPIDEKTKSLRTKIELAIAKNPMIRIIDIFNSYLTKVFAAEYYVHNKRLENNSATKTLRTPASIKISNVIGGASANCNLFLTQHQLQNIVGSMVNDETRIFIWENFWNSLTDSQKTFLVVRENLKVRLKYYFWAAFPDELVQEIFIVLQAALKSTPYAGAFENEFRQLIKQIPEHQKSVGIRFFTRVYTPSTDMALSSLSIVQTIDLMADEIAFHYSKSFEDSIAYITNLEPAFFIKGHKIAPFILEEENRARRVGHLIATYLTQS